MKASDSELVTVYSAASQLRDPAQLARDMLHDLAASRELAWRLFVRNVSARYRQTFLGYTWAVLPPLLTTLVFVCLHQAGFFSVEKTSVPYGLFVLSGMTFWQLFADALQAPMRMVSQSAPMLTKVRFPREALILAAAGEVLFAFAIRFALLIAAMVWFKQPIGASFVLLPLGILALTDAWHDPRLVDHAAGNPLSRREPRTALFCVHVDVCNSGAVSRSTAPVRRRRFG